MKDIKLAKTYTKPLVVGVVLMSGLLSFSSSSRAGVYHPPAGSTQWLRITGNECANRNLIMTGTPTLDDGTCASSNTGQLAVADYVDPSFKFFGESIVGGGSSTASQMDSHLSTSSDAVLKNAMVDTYTVNSSTLADGTFVDVTVNFSAHGSYHRPSTPTCLVGTYCGISLTNIEIGSWLASEGTVNSFLPFADAEDTLGFQTSNPGPDHVIDLFATKTMSVAVGTAFDIAYLTRVQMLAIGAPITLDVTSTISFSLAPDLSITSAKGFGVSAVPVPAAAWLFGSGLLGLIGVARRK